MTDKEIIQGLIERNECITQEFFFRKCRPLFYTVMQKVFDYEVDYDEFVNELYVYLMENNAQKLKDFQFRCSVYHWLKMVAIRYFIKRKKKMIDMNPKNNPYDEPVQIVNEDNDRVTVGDLERLFIQMPTPRYVYVIRKLLIDDCEPATLAQEMNITTANLYNIKRRAMAQLTLVALNDIKKYGK